MGVDSWRQSEGTREGIHAQPGNPGATIHSLALGNGGTPGIDGPS